MSLDLTWQEACALWAEAAQQSPPVTSIDRLETLYPLPPQVGSGHHRVIQLQPGVELLIFNCTFRDVTIRMPENQHPVQFAVHLSGIVDGVGCPRLDPNWGYIGSSGVQRPWTSFFPELQRQVGVNIHMQPQLLAQFFGVRTEEAPAELQLLTPGQDQWQQMFSPKTTEAMRSIVKQIIDCPFMGAIKRLYLQGKILELMALQLEAVTGQGTASPTTALKPDTIARIHYAAEILRSHLEHPPIQIDLARQVGLSDRTLQKGFKAVFGVTPFVYLTQQRMRQAERLLRESERTVAEVANIVGYVNPAQFAAAFKRQLGITPSECLGGKNRRNSLLG